MTASLCIGSHKCCLINVFLPHDNCSEHVIGDYSSILGQLQTIMDPSDASNILLIGANADLNKGRLWSR